MGLLAHAGGPTFLTFLICLSLAEKRYIHVK